MDVGPDSTAFDEGEDRLMARWPRWFPWGRSDGDDPSSGGDSAPETAGSDEEEDLTAADRDVPDGPSEGERDETVDEPSPSDGEETAGVRDETDTRDEHHGTALEDEPHVYESPNGEGDDLDRATRPPVTWPDLPPVVLDSSPYRDSHDHLLDELERIEALLELRVRRWRAEMGDSPDSLTSYFISDEKVDRLFGVGVTERDDRVAFEGVPYDEQRAIVDSLWNRTQTRKWATRERGRELRLVTLTERFGLTPHEVDVLLLAVAPEFDGRFETFYAYLRDDATRTRPTVDLVLRTLSSIAARRSVDRALFARTGTLRRNGLVRLSGRDGAGLPNSEVTVDERIVDYLLERDAVDASLTEYVDVVPVGWLHDAIHLRTDVWGPLPRHDLFDGHVLDGEVVVQLENLLEGRWRSWGEEVDSTNVVADFNGPSGAGRRVAVATLTAARGRRLLVADVQGLLGNGVRETVDLLVREARLREADVAIANLESLDSESRVDLSPLLRRLDDFEGWVYLLGDEPLRADQRRGLTAHRYVDVAFPVPSYDSRRELWREADRRLDGGLPPGVDISELAGKFRLTGGQIADAIEAAESRSLGGALTAEDVSAGCRALSREKLSTLGRVVDPVYEWDDIVLPEDTKAHLREVAAHVKYQGRVYDDWGFKRKFSLGNGVVTLFTGPSGTGKTMAAEIIAKDADLDLYKIDLSSVVSKYIGETEKNLGAVFDEAENSNAILFFDEADALFGKRSEVSDAHDRYANIEVNYLLQRVEEHDGAVILTTNFKQNIDDAFLRRIHSSVDFPLPDSEARELIWRNIFPAGTPVGALDYEFLSSFELTGGNIKNVALASAFLAASEPRTEAKMGVRWTDREAIPALVSEEGVESDEMDSLGVVEMEHVVWATRREFQKTGKLVRPEAFGAYRELLANPQES